MQELIDARVLESLPMPAPITETQLLWIGPSYDVWIADEHSPLDDRNRRLVKPGDPVRRQRWGSMTERISTREDQGVKRLLTIDKRYVPNPLYSEFVHTLASVLAEAHGAMEMPRPDKEPQIRWDFIASYLRSGAFDFCYDPYFLSPTRRDVVDVIQFGWISEITVFVDKNSPLYPEITHLAKNGKGLRDTLIAVASDHKLEIGVLGECAATTELYELLSDKLGVFSCITSMRDEIEMRWWIEDDPVRRIIVGDIGLVPMLKRVTPAQIQDTGRKLPKGFDTRTFAGDDALTRFKMTEPDPVGFVTLRDERWQNEIRCAFVAALWKERSRIPWEGTGENNVTAMLAAVGVTTMPLEQLLTSLGRPDVYDRLKAEYDLAAALESDQFEKAATLRDRIKDLKVDL